MTFVKLHAVLQKVQDIIDTFLLLYAGYLYFGVNDGRILRMSLTSPSYEYDVVLNSTYVFPGDRTCSYSGPADQANCGRHLGIRFDSKGKFMYSLDAYTGIYKTDLKTKVVSRIFDEKTRGIDRRIVFLDDFVTDEAANGGNIHYITDSSANWPVDYCGPIVLLKDTTGRLLKFDEETQTVEVLMESLTFPNGIELSDDKQSVIFNELGKRMTWRHYIKGAKKGKSEVICDNLPGYPDNLRRSARKDRETYWIAFYEASNPEKPNHLVSFLEKNPRIVEFTSRLFFNVGKMVMDVGVMFSFQPLIDTGFYIKTTQFHQKFLDFSSRGLAIEVDINCNILRSIHSAEGRVTHLSEIREVLEGNGQSTLYLGSYYNDYLGKLTLHDR